MKNLQCLFACSAIYLLISCTNEKPEEKGFQVGLNTEKAINEQSNEIKSDSLKLDTRPGSVLITGIPHIRLTTVYKVNVIKKSSKIFIGSNSFYYRYEDSEDKDGNNWHNNLMPGLSAVYGYNMVNISYYDRKQNMQKTFFEKPVLIKTLYYPAASKDTLFHQPINRNYFLVSVYNDDTNEDGFINQKDLRRFYLFDENGERHKALIPENYSVFKSEYDPYNDFMFVYAQLDSNQNGKIEVGEPTHIFWIDLKDPKVTERQY